MTPEPGAIANACRNDRVGRGMGIDVELIKQLMQLMVSSNVSELEFEGSDMRLKLRRNGAAPSVAGGATAHAGQAALAEPAATELVGDDSDIGAAEAAVVKSPIVGTFYRAPAPGAEPFVNPGDYVTKGKTLCIIEAMKVMNEIESDLEGKVVKILIEDAQPVEYSQPLMWIEPA